MSNNFFDPWPTPTSRSAEFTAGATRPPTVTHTNRGRESDEIHLADVSDNHNDAALATHVGFSDRHHGYDVQRYKDDASATVRLWKT